MILDTDSELKGIPWWAISFVFVVFILGGAILWRVF